MIEYGGTMTKNMLKYLIVGNSAGGIGAVEGIRTIDKQGTIGIISDEPYQTYSRPLISHYLAEPCPIEKLLYRSADFYEKNGITTFLGKKVKKIDCRHHSVLLNTGEKILWGKLLLATGGSPIIPKIKGVPQQGVFTFTTLDDAIAIDQYLNKLPQDNISAVVVGGGLIGVSVTEALAKRGVCVSIVEMRERILNTILDEHASAIAAKALQQAGVDIITGSTVNEVKNVRDNTLSAVLGSNREILCNLVVLAIGVIPRVELATDAGIKVNRGIVVNKNMVSSSPDIYACGDTSEAYDFIYDECRLTPIWPNAYIGGKVAGLNMAGSSAEYPGGTALNSLPYFGLDITSAGIINPGNSSFEIIENLSNNNYRKIILKDGLIKGMIFTGMVDRSGIIYHLMKDRINTESFKKELIADDFGMASLPEEVWRSRLKIQAPETNTNKCTASAGEIR